MPSGSGFEVGSIFARLGLDTSSFDAALNETLKKAEAFAASISKIFSSIQKDINGVSGSIEKSIGAATARGTSLGSTVSTSTPSTLIPLVATPKQAEALGDLSSKINGYINSIASSFNGIISTASRVGSTIKSAFNVIYESIGKVLAPITSFGRSLLNIALNNRLLLSLGAVFGGITIKNLIETANRAEKLSNGFDSLSKSIGAVSNVFLTKLREATRGTINDMDLMENANAAILLGAAKSESQYVELANAARRLGQAMGIDVGYALKSLSYGIGRQSRLWLDNLGIIVQAGQAQQKYAIQVGKTVDQLTEAERREAFFVATQDAIRKKMRELGPDIELVANAWERMNATLSNFWMNIGRTIVSSNIANSITGLLKQSEKEILVSLKYISDIIGSYVNIIIDTISRVVSGKLKLSLLISAAIQEALNTLLSVLMSWFIDKWTLIAAALIPVIVRVVKSIIENVLKIVLKKLAEAFPSIANAIGLGIKDIEKIFSESRGIDVLKDRISELFSVAPFVNSNLNRPWSWTGENLPLDRFTKEITEELPKLLDLIGSGKDKESARAAAKRVEDILNDVFKPSVAAQLIDDFREASKPDNVFGDDWSKSVIDAFSEAFKNIITEVKGGMDRFMEKTGTSAAQIANIGIAELEKDFNRLDPLFGLRPLVLDEELQPLSNLVEKIKKFRHDLFTEKQGISSILLNIVSVPASLLQMAVDPVGAFVTNALGEPGAIVASGTAIKYLSEALTLLNTPFAKFRETIFSIPEKSFHAILTELEEYTQKLAKAASDAKMNEVAREYSEVIKRFEDLDKRVAKSRAFTDWLINTFGLSDKVAKKLNELADSWQKDVDVARSQSFADVVEIEMGKVRDYFDKANEEISRTLEIIKRLNQGKVVSEETLIQTEEFKSRIDKLRDAFKGSEEAANDAKGAIDRIGENKDILKDFAKKIEDISRKTKEALDDIKDMSPMLPFESPEATTARRGVTDLQKRIQELEDKINEISASHDLSPSFDASGALTEISKIQDEIDKLNKSSVEGLEAYFNALTVNFRKANIEIIKDLTTTIGEGIVDGFLRGEKSAKIWASIASDIFRKQMSKAINDMAGYLGKAFDKIFSGLGGTASGIAGVALGAIAMGAALIGALQGAKDTTVEDFSDSVNSSEAMRGVVAGQTNVAIAKIGDSLKTALGTTEVLLLRIAQGVDRLSGGSGGSAGGPGVSGLGYSTSTSTPS